MEAKGSKLVEGGGIPPLDSNPPLPCWLLMDWLLLLLLGAKSPLLRKNGSSKTFSEVPKVPNVADAVAAAAAVEDDDADAVAEDDDDTPKATPTS